MREHDVPYHVRFEIDTDVRCGHWFTCRAKVRARQGAGRPAAALVKKGSLCGL